MSTERKFNALDHDSLAQAEAQLRESNSSPFSPPAFDLLKSTITEYISELVRESIRVSKRYRTDIVSAAHVERAAEYLVSSTSRRFYRHLGTVGGILLGAALSNMLAMTLTAKYTGAGTILSGILGIVGSFLIALHIARD